MKEFDNDKDMFNFVRENLADCEFCGRPLTYTRTSTSFANKKTDEKGNTKEVCSSVTLAHRDYRYFCFKCSQIPGYDSEIEIRRKFQEIPDNTVIWKHDSNYNAYKVP